MEVYLLEQTEADVPLENDWLSPGELARLDSLPFPKRRVDWRLGRWTAKRALAAPRDLRPQPHVLARIEIRPLPSGAPQAYFDNMPGEITISLSHRSGIAMCAVADSSVDLGCDLEVIEARSDAFLTDYFTQDEQAVVAQASAADRFRLLALLWSAKESALKAMHEGLRLDTRCVAVNHVGRSSDFHGWSRLHVLYAGQKVFHGWCRQAGAMVQTLIADPAPNSPILLRRSAYASDHVPTCA